MAERIIISIKEDGSTAVTTQGFKGKSCTNASQFIEEALGKIASLKRTGEYYDEEIPEKVRLRNGGK
jgi:glycine/serine hydroxymethyltransferase